MCGQGTAEKLVQHLVLHSPAADPTYVDDFLLTYRTFLKSACDITAQLMQWLDDPAHADKVLHHEFHDADTDTDFLARILARKSRVSDVRMYRRVGRVGVESVSVSVSAPWNASLICST